MMPIISHEFDNHGCKMGLHDRDWYREETKRPSGGSNQPGKDERRFQGYFRGKKSTRRRERTPWLWLFAPWLVLLIAAKILLPQKVADLKDKVEHLWLSAQHQVGRGFPSDLDVSVLSQAPHPPAASLWHGNGTSLVEFVLPADRQGHYRMPGKINGQEVSFLVDTGATSVSIPGSLQYQLNLSQGRTQTMTTASDTYLSASTTINELTIGPFRLQNIEAVLNPRAKNNEILLGMSALKHLELLHRNGTLTLRGPGDTAYQPAPFSPLEPVPSRVGGGEQVMARNPSPAFDNAADNHRRLQEIQRKEEQCRYWRSHGVYFDLATVRENLNRYCR